MSETTTQQPLAKTRRLYDIGDDLMAVEQMLIDHGGEIPDTEEGRNVLTYLKSINLELTQKFDSYAALVTEFKRRAETRRAEIERMEFLERIDKNAAKALIARLKAFMEEKGIKRIDGDRFRVTLVNNSGILPLELDDAVTRDPLKAPPEYRKVIHTVDGQAVRAALDRGEELEFARFGKRGTQVRIK